MEEYSYTKLTRFLECPMSYMRKYLNEEKTESHGITECGSFMHEIMEKYEKGELKKEELVPFFEKNFNMAVVSDTRLKISEDFSKDMYSLYYQGFLNYLTNFNGIPTCKKIIDVEKEFHIVYNDDFSITGKIDLVFKNEDDDLCVLDHKSKNKFKSKKEQKEYARQLYLYAWASKTLYGKYPKYLIFNMMRGNPIYIDFEEKDMYDTLQWFDDTVQGIRNTITYDSHKENFVFCNNWCGLAHNELCDM